MPNVVKNLDVAEVETKPSPVEAIQQYVAENKPAIGRLLSGEFEISTMVEAEKLSTMLAAHTPCPDRSSMGFWELLANAVEHGNLEIDYDTKSALLLNGQIEDEIERRLGMEPYRSRVVNVKFKCTKEHVWLRVTDQGAGFDFKAALDAEMPMDRPNGRGILVARNLCFDTLTYEGSGNTVEATINL